MKKYIRILMSTVLISIMFCFSSFAGEGMGLTKSDGETEALYRYYYEDDTFAKNEWKQVWDNWYYFGEDGVTKQNTWFEIDGKWYYFDNWSIMLHDTVTPDGYTVGSDGAWLVDVPQKLE